LAVDKVDHPGLNARWIFIEDFLRWDPIKYEVSNKMHLADCIDAVITNPPYTLAAEFILRCRRLAPQAEIAMLLRLGFLESKSREAFWDFMGAADLYVLPDRPSFRGGGSDSATYAWFVWRPVWPTGARDEGKVIRLNYTPKAERIRKKTP
jgi:hypothetical protein